MNNSNNQQEIQLNRSLQKHISHSHSRKFHAQQ